MNIEKRINEVIESSKARISMSGKIIGTITEDLVEKWTWKGDPKSRGPNNLFIGGAYQHLFDGASMPVLEKIIQLIKKADEAECLTSNSEYIRECKKWFLEKK